MKLQTFISGQARLAVVVERNALQCVEAGSLDRVCRSLRDFDYLFGGVTDLQEIECRDWKEVSDRLDIVSHCDDALALLLIFLDRTAGNESRSEALAFLEQELALPAVESFLWKRLLTRPLPDNADLIGCELRAERVSAVRLLSLIQTLGALQVSVVQTYQAWVAIPESHFTALPSREVVFSALREAGAFGKLVRARPEQRNLALIQILADTPKLPRQPLTALLKAWVAEMGGNQAASAQEFADGTDEAETGRGSRSRKTDERPKTSPSVFTSIGRQKDAIFERMRVGDWNRAWQYIGDLTEFQLARSERGLLAKSLCDLAQEAKCLGAHEHQLELGERALVEAPDDVQAHSHRADALLCLGRLANAEAAYREAADRFPDNVVARNGLAEVLKAGGRLEEAEGEYRATVSRFPDNVVARSGLAGVLLFRGDVSEALSLVSQRKPPMTKSDWVAFHIHAMILFRRGELDAAAQLFRRGTQTCPWAECHTYFRRSLSLLDLRINQPLQAIEDLGNEESTLSNLLRFHAFSKIGSLSEADKCLRKAAIIPFPKCGELKVALETRFWGPPDSSVSENFLFELEFDCLLAA